MDVGGIVSVISGIKATKDLASAALSLATDTALVDKLNKLVHQVSDVQGALLETQSQLGMLIQEKHDLEARLRKADEEIREQERTQARLEEYELFAAAPQSFIYRYRVTEGAAMPLHYACPNCFAERHVRILQVARYDKHFELICKSCEKAFLGPVNPDYQPPAPRWSARSPYI